MAEKAVIIDAPEKQVYKIGRNFDYHIIKNAFLKPIELTAHHYQQYTVLINLETGDVCSQLYSADRNGLDSMLDSPICTLGHELFFSSPGKKVFFIFRTNHTGCEPSTKRYAEHMEKLGVINGGTYVADAKGLPFYSRYASGEFSFSFGIDLRKSPVKFTSWFYDVETGDKIHTQTYTEQHKFLQTIGNRLSSIPDVKKTESEYFNYSGVYSSLTYGNAVQMKESIDKYNIDLSKFPAEDTMIGRALKVNLRYLRPYSASYLYKNGITVFNIANALEYAYEQGLPMSRLIMLINAAAENFTSNVTHRMDEKSPEFPKVQKFGYWLYNFTVKILRREANYYKRRVMAEQLYDVSKMLYYMRDYKGDRMALMISIVPLVGLGKTRGSNKVDRSYNRLRKVIKRNSKKK